MEMDSKGIGEMAPWGEGCLPVAPIRVVADDREAGAGVVQALQVMEHVQVSIQRLVLGDYQVDEKLLFERKTLPDLVASIKEGRLFSQAVRLAQTRQRAALILEGTASDLAESGMRREAIQGALINVTLMLGLPILRSRDPQETAQLMLYAGRQVRAMISGSIPRKGARPKGKRQAQLFVLQGLPGIGPRRAAQLLDAFGSVQAVLSATAEDLANVPGIGQHTAEEIRWVVSEGKAEYGSLAADLDV
jgi:ERCC4-type nuclease